jgi:hypothetical protein
MRPERFILVVDTMQVGRAEALEVSVSISRSCTWLGRDGSRLTGFTWPLVAVHQGRVIRNRAANSSRRTWLHSSAVFDWRQQTDGLSTQHSGESIGCVEFAVQIL